MDKNASIYDFMDRKAVMPLIEEHLKGEKNRRLFIWSLLNVEAWIKEIKLTD